MFEGLVRQLLLGYLGRYIKDIQKEQLKITLWNEEVLLENVELILEAFDYLQLPFALKEGRVGRLSIKIPWKKLGWDPIIIIIEDVFVCACQRDDQEWSMDAVERREFAGKKAKLAAAELAKLSRRVCGYQAGQSFVSYISTKILDGIQVSIRNVHILYRSVLPHSAQTIFGVKLSSLTIMRQNSLGGKVRGGQVNKTVEIKGFQIYCYTCPGNLDLARVDMAEDHRLRDRPGTIGKHDVCVLAPVDVSMSLEVSRSANENGVPQYSISAETTTLVMSLDEVQLKQILALCDYLSICELREKYGRYRPWNNPLSRKHKGWPTVWWHYAQQAVLSDIRKRLKKNSWKYLGERLTYRRKYVNLYKIKLKCLREEQFIDDHILGGLEQMERQCDIEDILNYRSIAESELQDFLQNSSSSLAASGGLALEKPQNDDYSSNKSRGWLNWLSLGMLGAGGTDDSSQFSGVVSDEVIKDIYEATEFQPTLSFNGDSYLGDHKFFSEIKFYINQVSATLWNTNLDREVAEIIFTGMSTECKIWEESAVVITSVNSGRMINTCNKQDILLASRASIESNAHEAQDPCLSVQIDLSAANQELKLLVKVKLQPVEVVYDSEFFLNVGQFYSVLDSAKSQHERVMLSLNKIDDVRARVTEKAKYMLSRRAKVILDVNVMDIKLGVPLGNAYQESSKMVLEMGSVMCMSKYETDCSAIHFEEKVLLPKNNSSSDSTRFLDDQLQDFYHHFEIEGNGCEVKVINPYHPGGVSILEKFDASVSLASCVIPNEPVFEQFQVCIVMPSLDVHFSPSIYGAVLALITSFDALRTNPDSLTSPKVDSLNTASSELRIVGAPFFSVNVSLKSIRFHVDLEGDKENGCHLMLRLHESSIRYNLAELQKFSISVKALKMISQSSQVDTDEQFLCSFGHPSLYANQQDIADKKTCQNGKFCHTSADRCFLLHYEEQRNREIVLHKYTVSIGDVDCHCYPDIIRLLIEFADKITQYTQSYSVKNSSHADMNDDMPTQVSYFGVEKFGFSNFYEAGSFYGTCTTLDCFPFVTIYNSGYLGNLEDILVHSTVDWRKCFEVGNREIQSLESNTNKSELSQDVDGANILVDIDLMRMRMHFHDSSSTVATIFLPTTKLSLSICGDSFDILCSNKGLVLSSSWWIHNIQDYLWGPSSNDLSPIINVRVRKQKDELLGSNLEMSFSIQHVSCVLPPEFLSVIIGYFSLPDWCNKENEVTPSSKGMDSGGNNVIIYKFEVLDSTLFVPVEGREDRFLKLDIPQLYSSYIPDSCSELLMHGIPPDCLVPANKISERSHCLNVFGRDLSLSLLLLSGDELYSSVAKQYSGSKGISFITAFSNDVWVRIPQEVDSFTGSSTSICLMVKVDCGELIFQDIYTFAGLEALEDIVNKFSTIDEESKTFTSDIHQFLQSKKTEKGIGPTQPVPSTVTYTEIECHVKSLSVSLNHLGSNSVSFEQLARIDMQFICSASLENEIARFLDVKFDSLALFSHLHSVTLAELTSSSGYSTVLDIHLAVSDEGECEVNVLLPSLDIWLHVFDWIEIIHLIGSYQKPQISTMIPDVSRSSMSGVVNEVENLSVYDAENSPRTLDASSSSPSGYMEKKDTVFVLKSENIGIQVHIPLQVSREAFIISGEPQSGEGRHQAGSWKLDEGDEYIFAAVALQSRCSELVFVGGTARIKSNVEKVNGTVRVSEEKCSPSWPLFQISLVNIDAKILKDELDLVNLGLKIQCDSLDMWLSFHILVFWNCMRFIFPELESGPAQSVFGTSELEIKLKKVSLLLTDGRGSSKGPLLELLMRNLLLHAKMSDKKLEGSVASDILVNYNNMHKVLWEPFVEPWKCQMNIYRIQENSVLLNTEIMTDILVTSTAQLNLNVTESLFEVIFRANDAVKDAGGAMGLKFLSESRKILNSHLSGTMRIGSYAPYMLQNLTSLPLSFYVCKGPACAGDMNISVLKDGKFIHPDSSVPIHINETSEEQLVDKQLNASGHHYIIIQFEGTSLPSVPISMDLVGLSYFEVDFSKSPSKISQGNNGDVLRRSKHDEVGPKNPKRGYVIPVICDVSVQRYCKLIRLYSTVILVNATSLPFEVRFDIPFSVVPKILDPVYPGQELPLPLHLAEAGRVRWRPFGHSYVWSEVHNISDILSHEDRTGSMRSFVCSPSHPSNDPFRCCLSVQHICFPLIDRPDKSSVLHIDTSGKQTVELCNQNSHNLDRSKKPSIYQVVLCTPLVVKNYLPKAISLSIEGGGISRAALLSEEETSFFHIDSSHDLEVTFHFNGFKPSILKFQRMETFIGAAKLSGAKYSLSETVVFQPDSCNGPLYVSAEKTMDPLSGAREICFFVPFLLYNCTGFPIIISDSNSEMNGHGCIIPSCYDLDQSLYLERKDGLGLLCSSQDLSVAASPNDTSQPSFSKNRIVSTRKSNDTDLRELSRKAIVPSSSTATCKSSDEHDLDPLKASPHRQTNGRISSIQSGEDCPNMEEMGSRKVEAFMYSPDPNVSITEIMIRVSKYLPECHRENMPKDSWSSPFPLVQPTGSTNVLIPHLSSSSAHIVSVSSSAVAGPFSGRIRMITFQPRYVISNACSRNVCYKQKGPDSIFDLETGQHSHLQWTDTARELLVSIRFKEPGWQWSGCFLPDHLGDTLVKMRNYVTGAVNMIRVEVQNADVSIQEEKIIGILGGKSGTNLVLLSDDDTGFMPYRIDNFSTERLRVYQQRCETFETIVQPYTSCPYAWDEPCYPHRLTVEVVGERILGSFTLDDVSVHIPVCLSKTSEKSERTLLVSVHAEGAVKVLCVVDSSYHVLSGPGNSRVPQLKEQEKHDEERETFVNFKEKILVDIPFIGISLLSSDPQELLFACAKSTRIELHQSLDQQKFSFQISSFQIDNQLPNAPYPVILSFDREHSSKPVGHTRNQDNNSKIMNGSLMQIASDSISEPVICLAASTWRNRDIALVSFEYVSLRIGDFHLELEQDVILGLFDFVRTITSRLQAGGLSLIDSVGPHYTSLGFRKNTLSRVEVHKCVRPSPAYESEKLENLKTGILPLVVPIGAPWQRIHILARRQKKIYVENFDLAPIKLTLSFSSSPWLLRNGVLQSADYVIQRGLMALADVEGAQIRFKELIITHHMASQESIQEIIVRHYTRQLLHEMYKVFGSAGVIGNPMGFARSMGVGIKDFLSVPARSAIQSPAGLVAGMAQGTTSLLSNTVYAISDAATQFSRAAHKGIVAFTFDDQAAARMEKQQKGLSSHSKGVINEFLEGLTGLLQSPIRGAEKHGLPGVVSGMALGITGLIARPAASILEVTTKTAQSIRNRSKLHHMGLRRFRMRLPRPLRRDHPLRPYSWEEAVGASVLAEADNNLKLKDELLVTCKMLTQGGKFVVLTEKLVLIVYCSCLVDLGKPEFRGIPSELEWVVEAQISLDSVIHADTSEGVVNIVGSTSSNPVLSRERRGGGGATRAKRWNNPLTQLPICQTSLELSCKEAEELLKILLSTIEKGKGGGWGRLNLLHQSNVK